MTDILYTLGDNLYINITNKCPCNCSFCIRHGKDGVGSSDNLWFQKDPSYDEIIKACDEFDFSNYNEIVFCGYGEPTCALENLIKTAKYLKNNYNLKTRLNTNGLCDLINKKSVAPMLKGVIDVISISLNAADSKRYQEIVSSAFGEKSFEAMLKFAESCKGNIPDIRFTVVDTISEKEIEDCRKISQKMNIPLRVRVFDPNN